MNVRTSVVLALGLSAGIGLAAAAMAGDANAPVPVRLGPGTSIWLEGTSTLHDFESSTRQMTIVISRDAQTPASAGLATLVRTTALREVVLKVPVRTLESGKAGLDRNLWKTLRATEHPDITFTLLTYSVPEGVAGDTVPVRAEGTLEVAGAQRPATVDARLYAGDGGFWLVGRHALRMSEFGIKPPTMMLRTLRVGDAVTVHYRLLLVADARADSAAAGNPR